MLIKAILLKTVNTHSVERMTVNHDVTGSSPVGGATKNPIDKPKNGLFIGFFLFFVCFHVALGICSEIV